MDEEELSNVCVDNRTKLLVSPDTRQPQEATATRLSLAQAPEAEVTQPSSRHVLSGFYLKMCQKSPLTFTLAMSLCVLTQICMVIFFITQITSLEREFGFSTSQTGQIMSSGQIGSLCLVLPAGYMASRLHVPRAIAVAALCIGLTGVMAGLPRFIFPGSSLSSSPTADASVRNSSSISAVDIPPALCWVGEEGGGQAERCEGVATAQNGTSGPEGPSGAEVAYNPSAFPVFIYLIVCQVIRGGLGSVGVPLFVEYIERNARKTDTGFYMGIVSSVGMLGPALAFLGGGAISKLHVSLQETDLDPTHPDWVGAWWLGFLIFGSLTALAPIFVCRFPRHLEPPSPSPSASVSPPPLLASTLPTSSSSSRQKAADCGQHKVGGLDRPRVKESCLVLVRRGVLELKGFSGSLMALMANPVYMLLVLGSCLYGFAMNSTYLFLPKYMQDQFQLPAWKANYIMGGGELTMGTSGFLLGGWLTKRLKLTRSSLYKVMSVTVTLAAACVVAMIFIGCPQAKLLGQPGALTTSDNCSLSCACPNEVFPVCDQESRKMYFSPCHAGCLGLHNGVYTNCSCTATGLAHPGECPSDCSSLYYFSVVFYAMLFAISLSGPLHYLVVVRSVPDSQVGVAIGFNSFVAGIVSFLVGPIFFGGLIDSFCDHWKTPCGVQGQCSVYNKQRFRVEMQTYSVASMGLAIICCLLSFLIYVYCPRFSTMSSDVKNTQPQTPEDEDATELACPAKE